jgi:DNA-directed RNA polymerase subunit omega
MQGNVEIDEPEPHAGPSPPRRPMLGSEDQSTDSMVDMITEDQLLRGLKSLNRSVCERERRFLRTPG